ncbi:Serine protease gd [Camponotus floridanus]|uniref:Serine protease gd n=1 Tax=Camponotus floridanus TaxID=104421 RepID=E2AEC6_CAMFO|nr:Serine protease gd [Camponotus floridanus]
MAKVPILIVMLPQLFCALLQVSGQQSSCHQYFTYIFDPATNQVMGQIQILSPPKNVELYLKVTLSIAVALPTNYVGLLKVAQSKEEFALMDQRDKPLLYHIHFPLSHPIPLLTGIWFNDQKYCSGPHATGQVVTSITLDHTLYQSSVLPHSQNSYDSPQQNPDINFQSSIFLPNPQPTVPVYTSTLHTPVTQLPKESIAVQPTITSTDEIDNNPFLRPPPVQQSYIYECGISNQPITNNINPLISKGMKTSPGQWPWLVALFLVKIKFEFQCAGSILTQKHVITAAHCFKLDAQTNIPPSAMLASLGRYRLQEWHEAGSLNIEIASYTLHPDYNHGGSGDSDLAILTLRTPVEFSPRIKPICMWYDSIDLQSVVDKAGYVVGWGKDELGHAYVQEPRMAKVPIVSQESCLWSDQRFVSFTSNRTFCAGMRDGSGPCNGDSGSGLMLYDSSTGRNFYF